MYILGVQIGRAVLC